MGGILEDAENVASEAAVQADATEAAMWLEQIASVLAASPGYQFVFLCASPVDDHNTILRQVSNSTIPGVFWLLNVGGQELIRRTQEDQYD